MRHRRETGSILNFPGATNLSTREEALELQCDILIPAALENQITEENAGRVKAKILRAGRKWTNHSRRGRRSCRVSRVCMIP